MSISSMKCVHPNQVPEDANIRSSHVAYKVKVEDDDLFKLKAWKVPCGNGYADTSKLWSDCSMYLPTGYLIVLWICAIQKWRVEKVDVDMSLHQSGLADRRVYDQPSKKPKRRNKHWLHSVAGYGLARTNSKLQAVSYKAFQDYSLGAYFCNSATTHQTGRVWKC